MSHQRIIGLILVLAGGMLLVHQLGWVDLSGQNFIAVLSILLGISFFRKAFQRPDRRGVLGGTFLTLFGLAVLIFDLSAGPYARALFVGIIFVSLALANLAYYFAAGWQRNLNLFMFFFFGAIGASILLVYYNVWDVWQFEEIVSTYWPVILIVLGFMILIDGVIQKRKRIQQDQEEIIARQKEEEQN